MNRIITIITAALALVVTIHAVPANAQNTRSFVSAHGLDTNSCVLAAPCRTLAHALTQTNAGGEIDVLDPAGYGALVIDRAISIVNDGVGTAGVIVPSAGIGITINAGASDAVSLRGLSIEGGGVGQTGIQFNTGASLTVENCVIRHVTGEGVYFTPNASSNLSVANSLVADNGTGIVIFPTGSGTVVAIINRVEANSNITGIHAAGWNSTGSVNVTVSDSVAANNIDVGFEALSNPGKAQTVLNLFHSVAANNGLPNTYVERAGIYVQNAVVRLAQSMVTGNFYGWNIMNPGTYLYSYGDNYIDGNGSNVGGLTLINKQ